MNEDGFLRRFWIPAYAGMTTRGAVDESGALTYINLSRRSVWAAWEGEGAL